MAGTSQSTNFIAPEALGVINVTDHGVMGDGVTDDTAALQKVLDNFGTRNIIYFPDGDYLVSDTLTVPAAPNSSVAKRLTLQGESQDGVTIRLADDLGHDRPVVDYGSGVAQAFNNRVLDLTIDIGSGNPDASGLRFNGNNQSTVRDVTIISHDGGATGLNMVTGETGPTLIEDITIIGFATGIDNRFQGNSITVENAVLRGQEIGIMNAQADGVFARGIDYAGPGTGFYNADGSSRAVVIDSKMTSTDDGGAAIVNSKAMYARDITAQGYDMVLDNTQTYGRGNGDVKDDAMAEYMARGTGAKDKGNAFSLWDIDKSAGLNLSFNETPEIALDPNMANWANAADFPGRTDAAKLQAAIDSGATTVYLPAGSSWDFDSKEEVILRGNVERLIGTDMVRPDGLTLRVADGAPDTVIIEGITDNFGYKPMKILHDSDRSVVLRDIVGADYYAIADGNQGDVFFANYVSDHVYLKDQNAYGRQMNLEGYTDRKGFDAKVINDGADFVVLGLKTEHHGTVLKTINGGRSEVLGSWHNSSYQADQPRFETIDASLFAAVTTGATSTANFNLVRETRDGVTRDGNLSSDAYIAFAPEARTASGPQTERAEKAPRVDPVAEDVKAPEKPIRDPVPEKPVIEPPVIEKPVIEKPAKRAPEPVIEQPPVAKKPIIEKPAPKKAPDPVVEKPEPAQPPVKLSKPAEVTVAQTTDITVLSATAPNGPVIALTLTTKGLGDRSSDDRLSLTIDGSIAVEVDDRGQIVRHDAKLLDKIETTIVELSGPPLFGGVLADANGGLLPDAMMLMDNMIPGQTAGDMPLVGLMVSALSGPADVAAPAAPAPMPTTAAWNMFTLPDPDLATTLDGQDALLWTGRTKKSQSMATTTLAPVEKGDSTMVSLSYTSFDKMENDEGLIVVIDGRNALRIDPDGTVRQQAGDLLGDIQIVQRDAGELGRQDKAAHPDKTFDVSFAVKGTGDDIELGLWGRTNQHDEAVAVSNVRIADTAGTTPPAPTDTMVTPPEQPDVPAPTTDMQDLMFWTGRTKQDESMAITDIAATDVGQSTQVTMAYASFDRMENDEGLIVVIDGKTALRIDPDGHVRQSNGKLLQDISVTLLETGQFGGADTAANPDKLFEVSFAVKGTGQDVEMGIWGRMNQHDEALLVSNVQVGDTLDDAFFTPVSDSKHAPRSFEDVADFFDDVSVEPLAYDGGF